MPWKDPEAKKAYDTLWRAINRERYNEGQRECAAVRRERDGDVIVQRWRKRNPQKVRAQWVAKRNVAHKPCEVCGDPNTDRHHPDYSRALLVRHLCRMHHIHEHRR